MSDPSIHPGGREQLCQWYHAAMVAVFGGVWGLGLTRVLAEAALWPLGYASPIVAGVMAVVGAVAAISLCRLSSSASHRPYRTCWPSFLLLLLPLPYLVGAVSRPLAGAALVAGGGGLCLVVLQRERHGWLLPALLGAVTLGLYLRTLLPSVGEADTFEFQVVVPQLGVAHPTGYPLYVLLGKLFTLLPLRGPAWRLNLASAIFAVAAVLVLYDIIRRLTKHALASFLAALAFAVSPTFWSQAVVAEVYALHASLVAVLLWLLLLPDGERGQPAGRRWKIAFLVLGVSLTNHLTTVLLLPAALLTLLVDWRRGHVRWRAVDGLAAAALFVLGLTPYLFIPVRWPALHDGASMTLREFLTYVTGGQFHAALRLDGWQDPTRWQIVTRLILRPFGWPGVGLAAVGLIDWALRRRRALLVTVVSFLAWIIYGLDYYVADIAVFMIPAHLVLAVWMAGGVAMMVQLPALAVSLLPSGQLSSFASRSSTTRVWSFALVTLVALLPLGQIWTHLPAVDRSGERERYAWGTYVLRQPIVAGGAVLADPKRFAPLYYIQQIEGVRPDLDIVLLGTEELYQADLRRRLAAGQVVYLARYLPHLEGFYLRSVGPLAEVRTSATDGAHGAELLGAGVDPERVLGRLPDGLRLLDAEVETDPLGRALVHATLHWQAETEVDSDLVVRLRLVGAPGSVPWTSDGVRPVNGLYPTNAWPPGVAIADYHEIPIEPWVPPGRYSLQVGLFPRLGSDEPSKDAGLAPWVTVHTLQIGLGEQTTSQPRERVVRYGDDVWLTSANVPQEGIGGSPVTVDLGWRHVTQDESVQLWWVEAGEVEAGLASLPEIPADDLYTFRLRAGMVRSRHVITAPAGNGLHSLRIGLAGEPARCGWLAAARRSCALASMRILTGERGLANFGDLVLLVEGQIGQREAQPGELVQVRLLWRGLRTLEADYTVFAHLVGPDGRLHGQVDSWPVQGTYPTSQWRPGTEIPDPYEVPLAPDAPVGRYRVEVGLYRLETMARLRVLDEAGTAIGDSFVVGRFDVSE